MPNEEKEIIRLLSEILSSVQDIENEKDLLLDYPLSFQDDLLDARKCGRYKGLIQLFIFELRSGRDLKEISFRKG